ncbi:GNAT family N-acetyltransferase [Bacillus haikouensis]|nr:GNAT family N-acetyltransferase [[Bacillus] enclensis]MBH9964807.1 GNAT family N-acetyltransferase [[Bacillus] enclensis]QWC21207.1 GNAT family N-acetyltransferase [Bacillus haikouensis]
MENVTSIRCENITEEIIQKYKEKGFKLIFQEFVMEHDLKEIPQIDASVPLRFQSWSSTSEADFYEVYDASFKDRPGFPGWSMDKWVGWIASSPTFLKAQSYLAAVDNQAAGFIALDTDPEFPNTKAYISQVGVIPEWRGKGIAASLTCKCLEECRQDGMNSVTLHVNQNNPGAIRLYERLGFETVRTRGRFEAGHGDSPSGAQLNNSNDK